MTARHNPFTPSFGTSPPVLAGRDDILADWDNALEAGPHHPDYTLLLLGMRGAGKTAMLNAVEERARKQGWLTISEDAAYPGLLTRITSAAASALADLDTPRPARRITGLRAGGFGVDFETSPSPEFSQELRTVLTELSNTLHSEGAGLLVTIDELQAGDLGEIRRFGSVIQHLTRREAQPIAFVGAGLPQIEEMLLAGDAATFLQRCARRDIGPLSDDDTAKALALPISNQKATIAPEGLRAAIKAVSGYAFMTQLVGFHIWKAAADPHAGITFHEAAAGIATAERQMSRLVLAPVWKGLSDVDRRFLMAMTLDAVDSRVADVADRLGVTVSYAGVYRHRLIKAGMITPVRKGRVTFAHHATREWLKQMPKETI